MLQILSIMCLVLAVFLPVMLWSSESTVSWENSPVIYWNGSMTVHDVLNQHTNALLTDTPWSQNFLDEVQQSMMDCDLYNSRHAQFQVTHALRSAIMGRILYPIFSLFTYLRAGIDFYTYAETFPKYYRDYINDEHKHENSYFWRDAIATGFISTRVFHGNLERCPETLDIIKNHVYEKMGYWLETNATVFASTRNNIATPAHRHPQNGTLFILGLRGTRKFAIMRPECLSAQWRMANNTFFPFEPFLHSLPFVYDYSCALVTGTIHPGDVLLTDLYYPHHFIGESEDSTVISFFDKAYHPFEMNINEHTDVQSLLDVMSTGLSSI